MLSGLGRWWGGGSMMKNSQPTHCTVPLDHEEHFPRIGCKWDIVKRGPVRRVELLGWACRPTVVKAESKWGWYCWENALKWSQEAIEKVWLDTRLSLDGTWLLITYHLKQVSRESAQCSRNSRYLLNPCYKITHDCLYPKNKYFLSWVKVSHNSCQTTVTILWVLPL